MKLKLLDLLTSQKDLEFAGYVEAQRRWLEEQVCIPAALLHGLTPVVPVPWLRDLVECTPPATLTARVLAWRRLHIASVLGPMPVVAAALRASTRQRTRAHTNRGE